MKIEDVFGDLPTLGTDRLRLRKISVGDEEELFEYASDLEVAKHTLWGAHKSIEDTKSFVTSVMDQYRDHQVAPWGVVHKGNMKLIGTCGFIYWIPDHARAEIGYALSRTYWGKGYMAEAVREVISFGWRTMELNRIEAKCRTENTASARVLEKVGMKFEGILRRHIFSKGAYHDMKMYSILRSEVSEAD